MMAWLLMVSAWANQTINLWVLFGHHDMTVSARCYINRDCKGWNVAYKVINALFGSKITIAKRVLRKILNLQERY